VSLTWSNHAGTQHCHPRAIVAPRSLEELVELVQRAEREQTTVRAVGAGHAWSDIALTDGYLVLPDRLGGPIEVLGDGLVRVRAATHLRRLNAQLEAEGLALANMGGYDGQTLAGVVSTSTHGTGLAFGPFPDIVHSVDLVVSGGRIVRVEPSEGITRDHDGWLIQDDETFAAAVCGLGTLGIAFSFVISVRERFWLQEVRTLSTWEAERERLRAGGVLEHEPHYELFVNPYRRLLGSKHVALVTRRTDCPDPAGAPPDRLNRHPLTELEARLPLTGTLLRFAARRFPRLITWGFNGTLKEMCDPDYRNVSYKVFNIGEANELPAVSMELGIPLAGDAHIAAVDRLLEIAARERRHGRFHTSPFSLRFVAGSRALASMMHGGPTMMIELILVTGTRGGEDLLATYERELPSRPHWGQYNVLAAGDPGRLYPAWEAWRKVESQFNASGVFDSPFTRRVGI
jgi:L-gulono-1,4-lactone dehydrogenase